MNHQEREAEIHAVRRLEASNGQNSPFDHNQKRSAHNVSLRITLYRLHRGHVGRDE